MARIAITLTPIEWVWFTSREFDDWAADLFIQEIGVLAPKPTVRKVGDAQLAVDLELSDKIEFLSPVLPEDVLYLLSIEIGRGGLRVARSLKVVGDGG